MQSTIDNVCKRLDCLEKRQKSDVSEKSDDCEKPVVHQKQEIPQKSENTQVSANVTGVSHSVPQGSRKVQQFPRDAQIATSFGRVSDDARNYQELPRAALAPSPFKQAIKYESRPDFDREASSTPQQSTSLGKLKSTDLGHWSSPNAPTPKDSKSISIPIELFIRRIQDLASRYGDNAVLDVLPTAMVNELRWFFGLRPEDKRMTQSIDGWCRLLRRDFGIPAAEAYHQAQVLTYRDSISALDYFHRKNLLWYWLISTGRIFNIKRYGTVFHHITSK